MNLVNFRFETGADGVVLLVWDMPDRSMNVITEAVMDELEKAVDAVVADPHAATLDLVAMVRDLPTETVDEATAIAVRHGSVFPAGTFAAATERQPVAVVGDLVGQIMVEDSPGG